MSKLINLNIIHANNEICVWREDVDEKLPFRKDIESNEAMGDFDVPRYIVVATFDDGSVRVGGVCTLNEINGNNQNYDWLFRRDQFLHFVTLYDAMAFVRYYARIETESSAKKIVYDGLIRAGVTIWNEAKEYLLSENTESESDK